jgi:hypothetical protein
MSRPEHTTYVHGEVPISASVGSAQRASPEQIVEIGKKIWGVIAASGVRLEDDQGCEALLGSLQNDYKDFATSFPLVLRWAVQLRQFSPKAFHKYLLKHATTPLHNQRDFLELQAEYLVFLFRERNSHADEAKVRQYRESVVEMLVKEEEQFKKIQEEVAQEVKRSDAAADRDRRQRLYESLLAQKVAREQKELPEGQSPSPGTGSGPKDST